MIYTISFIMVLVVGGILCYALDYIRDKSKLGYLPTKVCIQCKGACCKKSAGAAWPNDFYNLLYDALVAALSTGKWAIDWWEGDPTGGSIPQVYFVRPKHKMVNTIEDPSWGGECIFLTSDGCCLTFEERPTQCRMLKPSKDMKSDCAIGDKYNKRAMAIAWMSYQDVVIKALNAVTELKK